LLVDTKFSEVDISVAVTLAFETTAPVASVTVPSSVAFTACPGSECENPSNSSEKTVARTGFVDLNDIVGSLRFEFGSKVEPLVTRMPVLTVNRLRPTSPLNQHIREALEAASQYEVKAWKSAKG
jgi:hypothetical protein